MKVRRWEGDRVRKGEIGSGARVVSEGMRGVGHKDDGIYVFITSSQHCLLPEG